MKILPVAVELFHAERRMDRRTDRETADRQTDMTKLIVAFRNIANAPKNITKKWLKLQ
jgi:hypothetical protein